jgi:hypothetical protein
MPTLEKLLWYLIRGTRNHLVLENSFSQQVAICNDFWSLRIPQSGRANWEYLETLWDLQMFMQAAK